MNNSQIKEIAIFTVLTLLISIVASVYMGTGRIKSNQFSEKEKSAFLKSLNMETNVTDEDKEAILSKIRITSTSTNTSVFTEEDKVKLLESINK